MFTIGAFAILFDDQQRVLLCHRRDMDAWNLPGGGVEAGELPTEATIREVLEETGLAVTVQRLVGVYGKADRNELVFAFVCQVVGGALTTTDESDRCHYFDVNDLPPNTIPKHVARIRDAVADAAPVFIRQDGISTREWLAQLFA